MDSSKQKVYTTVKDGIKATVRLFKRDDGSLDCDANVEFLDGDDEVKRRLPLLVSGGSET